MSRHDQLTFLVLLIILGLLVGWRLFLDVLSFVLLFLCFLWLLNQRVSDGLVLSCCRFSKISSSLGRFLIEHIEWICSLEFQLFFIQGCSANSYDGNRQKIVRISQLVRISRTMYVKFFDKIMDFSSRISDNF